MAALLSLSTAMLIRRLKGRFSGTEFDREIRSLMCILTSFILSFLFKGIFSFLCCAQDSNFETVLSRGSTTYEVLLIATWLWDLITYSLIFSYHYRNFSITNRSSLIGARSTDCTDLIRASDVSRPTSVNVGS